MNNTSDDNRDRLPLSPSKRAVGSVFLGDIQRHRIFSSSTSNHSGQSTPPSSPPHTAGSSVFSFHHRRNLSSPSPMSKKNDDLDIDLDPAEVAAASVEKIIPEGLGDAIPTNGNPGKVDPVLALELRLRWLEALILGVKQDLGKDRIVFKGKGREADYAAVNATQAIAAANLKPGDTLVRLAQTVQVKLDKALDGNEGLKRFMDSYDQHAHLLTPSFALSGILPDAPAYDKMSLEEINAFLAEMEPDIRAADRDMLEVDALEKKGVLGAGKLPDHQNLDTRLRLLTKSYEEDAALASSLEARISSLVQRHATYVDTLSELFVAWDDTLTDAEEKLSRMERNRAERLRLGLP
ncbi:hypothetical protein CPB83DRAFT_875102 [Crepidotus variabilis]|uniref:Uncharacterized protein n=1 Tax=Crepidotus variabilis TaxID=179855 RepID=A0A9P6EJV6_9AGAR|nr:hypothetical protein CPB83DRAFT_875102 [Crepidotus variabilis]